MKKSLTAIALAGMLLGNLPARAEPESWNTDFEQAKKEAADKKLPILAVFTGSDWCTWCMEFEKTVLSQAEFKNYAKESFVLFKADFPNSKKMPEATKKQNEKLAEKYGVEAFPTVLLLNADGKVMGKTGFLPGGAAKYVEHLKTLKKG